MEVPTLKPLSEDQARFYFQDLIKGIEYRKPCGGKLLLWKLSVTASWWKGKVSQFPAVAEQVGRDAGLRVYRASHSPGNCLGRPLPPATEKKTEEQWGSELL